MAADQPTVACSVCEKTVVPLSNEKETAWKLPNERLICRSCIDSNEMYEFLCRKDWTTLNIHMFNKYRMVIEELPHFSSIHYEDLSMASLFKYLEGFPVYYKTAQVNEESRKTLLTAKFIELAKQFVHSFAKRDMSNYFSKELLTVLHNFFTLEDLDVSTPEEYLIFLNNLFACRNMQKPLPTLGLGLMIH